MRARSLTHSFHSRADSVSTDDGDGTQGPRFHTAVVHAPFCPEGNVIDHGNVLVDGGPLRNCPVSVGEGMVLANIADQDFGVLSSSAAGV